MSIRPTLLIGLGSSGVRIIRHFRRFMFEQFSRPGLPIFGYIGIETDSRFDASDELLPKAFSQADYENIDLVSATVVNKDAVDQIQGDYRSELNRWLDPGLLHRGIFPIDRGAGSVRMAGRLALWTNWQVVQSRLTDSHERIRAMNSKLETETILKNSRLFDEPEVSGGFDIYVLGTLCGGTCGGMFVDMAYQVQKLFDLKINVVPMTPQTPAIYGIFTILDAALAMRLAGKERNGANCWSSLLELDYYMSTETSYDYRLPGVLKHDYGTVPPFSVVQLVSRTNQLGLSSGSDDLNHFQGDDLNNMIALKIFNNIFSELDSEIAAAAVDPSWPRHHGPGAGERQG